MNLPFLISNEYIEVKLSPILNMCIGNHLLAKYRPGPRHCDGGLPVLFLAVLYAMPFARYPPTTGWASREREREKWTREGLECGLSAQQMSSNHYADCPAPAPNQNQLNIR